MSVKGPPTNPVLDEHLTLFDGFMQKWRTLLNLRDWRVVRIKKRERKNMAAIISTEHQHKLARYAVGVDFGASAVTNQSLESVALHEMLHVRLAPLLDTVLAQGEYNDEVMEKEHEVIVVLEELLMQSYGERDGRPESN